MTLLCVFARRSFLRTQYLAPLEPDLSIDDEDDLEEEDPWPDNPVMGAEELLRFFRIRELLQT